MWYKYSIRIVWKRKESPFLTTRACLLAFSHTTILPAETAVFPQKLDFELATFKIEMEWNRWKTIAIFMYVLIFLSFNMLYLVFLFL
jgi:hypothetical protein